MATRVFLGPDGHVRVVKVKICAKEYTQPISKLGPLEFDEHQYIKEGENGQKNIKINN